MRIIKYKDKSGVIHTLRTETRDGETVVTFNTFTSTHNFSQEQYHTAIKELVELDGGTILEDKQLDESIRA